MRPYGWIADALADLDRAALRRRIFDLEGDGVHAAHDGRPVTVFCSNDYLGLSRHPQVVAAARSAGVVGSTGARLLSGSRGDIGALEREIASFLGLEAALVFSSGYLAAIGSIPALAQGADCIVSDARNHACLIDGIRLSGLPKAIYPAGTLPEIADGQRGFLVTEALFGMDAVAAPLGALAEAASAHRWQTLVDDAHGVGVVGDRGAGRGAGFAKATGGVLLGTLSKAVGTIGGFIAGPSEVVEYLISRARSFVFDTALPPPVVRAARAAFELLPELDARRSRIRLLSARLRERLARAGIAVAGDADAAPHLLAVVVGGAGQALSMSRELLRRGLFAPAIRPPTVPEGTSRIRISLTSEHGEADADALAEALEDVHATISAARH